MKMAACWMSPRLSSLACILVVLALSPRTALAISCSVCNSVFDEDCITSPDKYLKECQPHPMFNDSDHMPFCRKRKLTVHKPVMPDRVSRSCAYLRDMHHQPCRDYYPTGMLLEVCQCFTDACNTAPPSLPSATGAVWWWAAAAFALALFR